MNIPRAWSEWRADGNARGPISGSQQAQQKQSA